VPWVLSLLLLAAGGEKPKLVVLDLEAGGGLEASLVAPLTDVVTAEAQRSAYFDVISSRDIRALLGVERQRALLGCSEASSCMTELSGAVGARFVMSGTVSKLGDAFQLTLTALDTQKAQPLGRATRLSRSLETLRAQVPYAVAEATGTPAPAAPSKAAPITLLAVGGAATVFGLVWGAVHLSQEQQLAAQLETAGGTAGLLGPRALYEQQLRTLETQRWVALGSLGVGVAALVVGALWLGSETTQLALVPTGTGMALVGVFP
jgi:hypothetical protein